MPKYDVYYITKLSKHVGTFDVADESVAIEKAENGAAFQDIGSVCQQCTNTHGDTDEGIFIALVRDPPKKNKARK